MYWPNLLRTYINSRSSLPRLINLRLQGLTDSIEDLTNLWQQRTERVWGRREPNFPHTLRHEEKIRRGREKRAEGGCITHDNIARILCFEGRSIIQEELELIYSSVGLGQLGKNKSGPRHLSQKNHARKFSLFIHILQNLLFHSWSFGFEGMISIFEGMLHENSLV